MGNMKCYTADTQVQACTYKTKFDHEYRINHINYFLET